MIYYQLLFHRDNPKSYNEYLLTEDLRIRAKKVQDIPWVFYSETDAISSGRAPHWEQAIAHIQEGAPLPPNVEINILSEEETATILFEAQDPEV